MDLYLGVKLIKAKPMTRADYNQLRGWELPADENGSDAGYLVEYTDGGQKNHSDFDGYISWSPDGVFERSYRQIDGMSFGLAIEALKRGYRVTRVGWNGKGMFLYYVTAGEYPPKSQAAIDYFHGNNVPYRDYIAMKTVDEQVVPWVASQTDILAEDWQIVEDSSASDS